LVNSNSAYLIDANALLNPYRTFYQFDIAPSFWEQMAEKISSGEIILIENVTAEIIVTDIEEEKDAAQLWLEDLLETVTAKSTDTQDVIGAYGQIMNMIQQSERYDNGALAQWADIKIADPWLIAFAKEYNGVIVTQETRIDGGQMIQTLKIPNVAEDFDVEWINLFDMMIRLGIKL